MEGGIPLKPVDSQIRLTWQLGGDTQTAVCFYPSPIDNGVGVPFPKDTVNLFLYNRADFKTIYPLVATRNVEDTIKFCTIFGPEAFGSFSDGPFHWDLQGKIGLGFSKGQPLMELTTLNYDLPDSGSSGGTDKPGDTPGTLPTVPTTDPGT